MPWFKVDDQFAFHPKAVRAGNSAIGLWIRAGSWSAATLTDGYVPEAIVASLGGTTAQADRLVKADLWIREPDGYRFNDWSDYQPQRRDVRAARNARQNAAREANHERWHVKKGIKNPDCSFCYPDRSTDQ